MILKKVPLLLITKYNRTTSGNQVDVEFNKRVECNGGERESESEMNSELNPSWWPLNWEEEREDAR